MLRWVGLGGSRLDIEKGKRGRRVGLGKGSWIIVVVGIIRSWRI